MKKNNRFGSIISDGTIFQHMDKCYPEDGIRIEDSKEEISKAAAIMGRKGGSVKSEKKAKSSRENGKKGGRPRKKI